MLAQVGRGYSDLCAALCAVGTNAAELQVWKEVDGIFTADPRKVPTARLLSTITPEEAAELTYYGSEVIHPFTMEQVIRAAIPIRIKNVENPNGEGTIIFPDLVGSPAADDSTLQHGARDAVAPATAPSLPQSVPASALEPHLGPTAITIKDTVVVLSVHSNRKTISHGFFARIFGTLDKHGIVVDLISTSEVHVSMAIHGEIRKSVIDRVVRDLKVVGEVSLPEPGGGCTCPSLGLPLCCPPLSHTYKPSTLSQPADLDFARHGDSVACWEAHEEHGRSRGQDVQVRQFATSRFL